MPEQPKLAGGAKPRAAFAAAAASRVRVLLAPPGGGEPLSLWAGVSGPTVTLDVAAPEVAAGWAVAGRGLTGTVTAADGRTLTLTSADLPVMGPDAAPNPKPRRVREVQP